MTAKRNYTGLSAVTCDSAEAARTITLTKTQLEDRVTSIGFGVTFAAGAAGTTVLNVAIYKTADDGATRWCLIPSWEDIGDGIAEGYGYTARKTFAGTTGTIWIDVDARNCKGVKAIVSTDTADAGDTVTVDVCSDYNKG